MSIPVFYNSGSGAGALTDIIVAIETRLIALGFHVTEEVFDFEAVPDSIIDKAFRIESAQLKAEYFAGNAGAEGTEEISIWIAYKALRKPRAVWKTSLNDRETIEADLLKSATIATLASNPILQMNREASTQKHVHDYIVSKLVFETNYLKTL
jgi:hypothetical protein